jgi:DNA-binding response OmpR family regulator
MERRSDNISLGVSLAGPASATPVVAQARNLTLVVPHLDAAADPSIAGAGNTTDGLRVGRRAFPRILAVDDRPKIRALLEPGLGNLGFEVRLVPGSRVVSGLKEWAPEAILLDLDLSDANACFLIAHLRRNTDVPILVLSGQCDTEHKIRALSEGADDCIAEPFDWEELAAFIRARLRRPRIVRWDLVRYADVTLDVTQRKAVRSGKPLELSKREFDLLLALTRRPEQVFTRSQLLDIVWGVDSTVTPAAVETYICYLRAKVDAEGEPLIHTVRGLGYTLRRHSSACRSDA